MGVMLCSTGCADYDEDIKSIHEQINQLISGEIQPLKADLAKVKSDLEAAIAAAQAELKNIHDVDIANLKAADAALDAKIGVANDKILDLEEALAEEVKALEADIKALNTAIEAAKQAAKDADAALKAELVKQIADLNTELSTKLATLETKLNGDIAKLREDAEKAIADANAAIDAVEKRADALEAADKEFAEELKAIKADIKTLQDDLAAKYDELTKAVENLQKQIDANKTAIEANANNISKLFADVEKLTAGLEAANASIAAVNGTLINHINEFARYQVTVEGKIGAIQSQIDQINETIKNVEEELIPALEAQIAANAELINLNAADIAANAAALESFKKEATKTLENLLAADEAFRAMINTLFGDVASLKGDVAALYAQISASEKALAEQINTYYDQLLAKINAVDEKHTENYKTTLAELEAINAALLKVRNDLAAEAQARVDGDNAINTRIDILIQKYDTAIRQVNERVDAVEEALAKHVEAFEAYKKEVAEVIIPDAIAKAVAKANEYTNVKVAELKAELTEQHQKDIEALQQQVSDYLMLLMEAVDAELEAVWEAINSVEDRVAVNEEQIAAILDRVQSVVYVPKYSDGKATIEWAAIESYSDTQEFACTVIEGTSHIDYQVYPAECAEALAEAWNNAEEDLKSFLTFDSTGVTVRSEETSFEIVAVEADEEGILHIDFQARGLADEFYTSGRPGSQGYSISLVIANENANLSSCYTNLVANTEYLSITPGLFYEVDGDIVAAPEWIDHSQVDLTIPYTDKSVYKLMEGLELLYIDADGESYKWYDLADMGYEVERPDFMYKGAYEPNEDARAYFCYFVALSNGMIEVNLPNATVGEESAEGKYLLEAANGNLQLTNDFNFVPRVNLTEEATSESVGSILGATVRYLASGVELNTGMVVKIGKAIGNAAGTAANIAWTYDDDAEVDAARLNDEEATYSRKAVAVTIDEENANLHDFAGKYSAFIDSAVEAAVVEVAEDGTETEVEGVVATLAADEEENVTLAIDGFEFQGDKTYKLTFVYELESIDITVVVMVNTLDRNRQKVTLNAEDSVVLYKNIKFAAEKRAEGDETAPADMIVDVYTDIASRLNGIYPEADVYNEDVFVTNAYTETSTITVWGFGSENEAGDVTKTIEESWKTNFVLDGGVLEAYVGFAYSSFDFAVEKAKYVKNITLWYGQEIELVYDVTFTVPTNYDFKHNDLWVKPIDEMNYFSQVAGRYESYNGTITKDTRRLAKFSVDEIDMDLAFNVVNTDAETPEILTPEQKTALGISTKFFFVEQPGDGIEFNGNKIAYNGKDEFVHVNGKLMMSHSNGASFELPSSFDAEKKYNSYIVKKFNPLCKLTVDETIETRIEITEVDVYEIPVLKYFDLFESREGNGTPYVWAEFPEVNLIDKSDLNNPKWLVGHAGKKNGWDTGKTRSDIYTSFTEEFKMLAELPAEYKNNISFDVTTGILRFDNLANLKLQTEVEIPISLTVAHPWAETSETVTIVFAPKAGTEVTPEETPAE